MTENTPATERDELAEQGRQLASEREDLIAAGADPAELEVPIAPIDMPDLDPDDTGMPVADDLEELPALDEGDVDPDNRVGDFTTPDIDLSFLEVEPDKEGGDAS